MSEKVSIELTVEQAQAVRAWLQNNQAIVQNAEALRALEKASEKASKKSKDGFDEMAKAALKAASAYLTVQTGLQLIGQELDNINRKNKAAMDQQLNLAGSQRKAIDALRPGSDLTADELVKAVGERSTVEQKLSLATVTKALKEGGAGGSDRAALETGLYAQKLAPHLAEELPDLAAGAVDMQKQMPGLSPQQSVAQLVQMRRFSESSIGEISKDLVPAVARERLRSGGKDEAGDISAFFMALQGGMDEGNIGAAVGAGQTFLSRLSRAMGKPNASLSEILKFAGSDRGKKVIGQLRMPEAKPALMSMAGGGEVAQDFEKFKREMAGDHAEVQAREEARAGGIAAMPSQQTAEVQRGLVQGLERFRSDPSRALAGLEQQGLSELLVESGVYATEQKYSDAMKTIAPSRKVGDLMGSVKRRRRVLENTEHSTYAMGGVGFGPVPMTSTTRTISAEDQRSIEILKGVEEQLQKLVELQEAAGKTPTEVKVTSLPASNQPQPAAAGGLSDR